MRVVLTLVAVLLAVSVAGVAGATSSEIPNGWWKGTFVLSGQWDLTSSDGLSQLRGSGMLRIERNAFGRAEYKLVDFTHEASWTRAAQVPAECRGQVYYRKTAAGQESAAISVAREEVRPSGVQFSVGLYATFSAQEERPFASETDPQKSCDRSGGSGTVKPNGFFFVSRRSVDSRSHRGSAVLVADPRGPWRAAPIGWPDVIGHRPTPGGANKTSVSYDLAVVGPKTATGPVKVGPVVLRNPGPSTVTAVIEVTRGGQAVRPDSGTCSEGPWARLDRKWTLPALILSNGVGCQWSFNFARYSGKRFVGQLSVTVGKRTTTRSFSVLISGPPRTGLKAPRGAVLGKGKR